ncbi:YraN family protein [Thermoleophilia bacterium SCSIO 60948]|nr:YraN family protein [Thermoleophilia bacterium SCSIO 60948]
MPDARRSLGDTGEAIALRGLERHGARLLARNARVAGVRGELDLVVFEDGEIVFVEVKTRRGAAAPPTDLRGRATLTGPPGPETPAGAVGPRKQAKIRALASAWLREHRDELPPNRGIRFDVIGLRLSAHGEVLEGERLKAAF